MTDAETARAAYYSNAEQGDVVRVTWRDSSRVTLGWDSAKEYLATLDELMQALEETSGYFIGTNAAYVLIALNLSVKLDGAKSITDSMAIPHEAVRGFEILRRRADIPSGQGLTEASD